MHTKEFTPEEVHETLFSMDPYKAPGPNGFNPFFSQKFWEYPQKLNITIIPKVLDQFRPIVFCNVNYQNLSKILANKLRRLLDKNISPAHSVFVKGRQISDNTAVTHLDYKKAQE